MELKKSPEWAKKISYRFVMDERKERATGFIVLPLLFIEVIRKMMITVLLADDHAIIRDVLCRLLKTAGDIQIVATAPNGKDAVAQAVLHCPNVAVMDGSMRLMDGIEATRQICIACPQTRVLMVSGHRSPYYIQRCLQAGASGYVLKDVAGAELVIAVRSTHRGNRHFSEQIAEIAKRFIQ